MPLLKSSADHDDVETMKKRSDPAPVRTATVTHGIIGYDIRVYGKPGAYWGEWTCGKCCSAQGGSSGTSESIEAAVRMAKTNLSAHHSTTHADDGNQAPDDGFDQRPRKVS